MSTDTQAPRDVDTAQLDDRSKRRRTAALVAGSALVAVGAVAWLAVPIADEGTPDPAVTAACARFGAATATYRDATSNLSPSHVTDAHLAALTRFRAELKASQADLAQVIDRDHPAWSVARTFGSAAFVVGNLRGTAVSVQDSPAQLGDQLAAGTVRVGRVVDFTDRLCVEHGASGS